MRGGNGPSLCIDVTPSNRKVAGSVNFLGRYSQSRRVYASLGNAMVQSRRQLVNVGGRKATGPSDRHFKFCQSMFIGSF